MNQMPLNPQKYWHGATCVKLIGSMLRITTFRALRKPGFECDNTLFFENKNDEKLLGNISRARNNIFELAMCNPWELFATFTIDPKKYDRFNLERYHRDFAQWIRNFNKKSNACVKYLAIPEKHKNGAWHEHALLLGLTAEHLTPFSFSDKLPYYIRNKLKLGDTVYDWLPYREKFGYCDLEPIHSREAVSKYILKYITKDLASSVTELGAHLYYPSQGLQRAVELVRGLPSVEFPYDYENDYVRVCTLPATAENIAVITSGITPF